ncbi:Uma2 family endonuclease [Streptomyces sp. B6B3]|uniref:Uma2 family endonuclease n=1 Tax=Streptomyces sp. B6B3 TaxID=3153570 RepID=UPI00325C3F1B
MTVTEVERLHRALSRCADQFEGYKIEIIEGAMTMAPVRPHHGETIRRLGNALEAQLPAEWHSVVDVAFGFADDTELCPDLAVIPRAEADRNLSAYPPSPRRLRRTPQMTWQA